MAVEIRLPRPISQSIRASAPSGPRHGWARWVPRLAAVLACCVHGAAQAPPRAQLPWWDRTSSSTHAGATHLLRGDLSAADLAASARAVDLQWQQVDVLLGSLRPRSRTVQQVLVFAAFDDLADTVRTQFAIDPPGHAFAFFSPLGQGVAICTEDVPPPQAIRGLAAALTAEYVRLCCGGDVPPAVECGLLDLVARADPRASGAGAAAIAAVQRAIVDKSALPLSELLAMERKEWDEACAASSGSELQEQAASLVRFLLSGKGPLKAGAFAQFMREISYGATAWTAFARVYGITSKQDWNELDKRWREFAQKEQPNAAETLRERLAFLAEGSLMLEREGAPPNSFAELSQSLVDRSFVYPKRWRPGFSSVRAADASSFRPVDPPSRQSASAKQPSFAWTAPAPPASAPTAPAGAPQAAATSPPIATISSSDPPGRGLQIRWLKTRAQPEAPWVWDLTPAK